MTACFVTLVLMLIFLVVFCSCIDFCVNSNRMNSIFCSCSVANRLKNPSTVTNGYVILDDSISTTSSVITRPHQQMPEIILVERDESGEDVYTMLRECSQTDRILDLYSSIKCNQLADNRNFSNRFSK